MKSSEGETKVLAGERIPHEAPWSDVALDRLADEKARTAVAMERFNALLLGDHAKAAS